MDTVLLIDAFIKSRLAKGLSPQTVRWYRGILLSFAHYYPQLPTDPADIDAFMIFCRAGDERRLRPLVVSASGAPPKNTEYRFAR